MCGCEEMECVAVRRWSVQMCGDGMCGCVEMECMAVRRWSVQMCGDGVYRCEEIDSIIKNAPFGNVLLEILLESFMWKLLVISAFSLSVGHMMSPCLCTVHLSKYSFCLLCLLLIEGAELNQYSLTSWWENSLSCSSDAQNSSLSDV